MTLEVEQCAIGVEATAVAGEPVITSDDPVAWHEY